MNLRDNAIMIAGLGSAILLAAALAFQYLDGLPPCQLCIWQRWPHVVAILALLLWALTRWRVWPWLGCLAALAASSLGLFHVGVEQGWWEFISSCTQDVPLSVGPGAALLPDEGDIVAPPVRCDRIAWQFLGLSMAAWNAICSAGLAILWLIGASRRA